MAIIIPAPFSGAKLDQSGNVAALTQSLTFTINNPAYKFCEISLQAIDNFAAYGVTTMAVRVNSLGTASYIFSERINTGGVMSSINQTVFQTSISVTTYIVSNSNPLVNDIKIRFPLQSNGIFIPLDIEMYSVDASAVMRRSKVMGFVNGVNQINSINLILGGGRFDTPSKYSILVWN